MGARGRSVALVVAMVAAVVLAAPPSGAHPAATALTEPPASWAGGTEVVPASTPADAAAKADALASTKGTAGTLPAGTTAAPVNPTPTTLVQPDGSAFTATPWGDGLSHGYADAAGYTVVRRADGTWVYAEGVDAHGDLIAGTWRADAAAPPAGVHRDLRPTRPVVAPSEPPAANDGKDDPGATGNELQVPHTGAARTLVILAQFTDQASTGTTAAQWQARYFGATSSVHEYYALASYGALDVTPAHETHGTANDGIVGWLTLNRKHPNSQPITDDVVSVARTAIIAANPYVDYASFDTDGSGTIDTHELHIVVIAAGYEGSYAGDSVCGKALWGHRSTVEDPPTLDGKVVGGSGGGGYQMFGEKHCSTLEGDGGHLATEGIMVHEFGHDIGLPDLYPFDGEGGAAGEWSLMAYGSWLTAGGQLGDKPSLLDAFSRAYEGWVTPTVVHGANQVVSVPAAATSSTVYEVLGNPNGIDWASGISGSQTGTGEYYLIENRTQAGQDAGLPGCGILIWHIDETAPVDWPNSSSDRFLVELEQADGQFDIHAGANRGDQGDPYPGSSANTSFASGTNPAALRYNGSDPHVGVTVPAGACQASKSITISSPSTDVPPNDAFANATPLAGATVSVGSSNAFATKEAGEPQHAQDPGGASIWFRWTAPASGSLTADTFGSGTDTTLAIYTGSSVDALTEVASSDDEAPGTSTSAVFGTAVTAGTTYRIAIDGFHADDRVFQGSVTLNLVLDTATTASPFGTYEDLVTQQYLDLWGKAPTAASRASWVGRIKAKGSDRYKLVSDLRASTDNTGSVDPVARLYRAYFLRDPDRGGFAYWVGKKRAGTRLAQISSTFAGSSEFKTRYGSLGNRAFVQLIYQNVLGRPGETSGVNYWTGKLDAKTKTRGEVMVGFSESSEYIRTSKASIDLSVASLLLLGRQPNGSDIAYWQRQQALGRQSNVALARWAFATPDYLGRVGAD